MTMRDKMVLDRMLISDPKMTREERKQYVSDNFTFLAISDALSLIDQVYGDVAELEVPNMCNGCKYFNLKG